MSTIATHLAPSRSDGAARTSFRVACVLGGSILVAGLAQISFTLPFTPAAALVGWLARRGWDRSLRSSISAMLLGSIVIYAFGVPWLTSAVDLPMEQGLELGLYPFVIGDTLKLLAAAGLLPVAWSALHRLRSGQGD